MKRGFTLLEVIIALSILGMSLMAVYGISSQAIDNHLYAKKLTVATLLARSKMTDLEQLLYDKPLPADDEEDSGTFADEGWPSFRWRSRIIVPRTAGLSPEQVMGAVFGLPLGGGGAEGDPLSALFGGGGAGAGKAGAAAPAPGGAAAGAAGLGAMSGLMGMQFQQMVDTLGKSVREVHLTISWKQNGQTEMLDLVTHVVALEPGADRNQGQGGGAVPPGGAQPGVRYFNPRTNQYVTAPIPCPAGGGMCDPVDRQLLNEVEGGGAATPAVPRVPGMLGPILPGLTPQGLKSVAPR